MHNVPCAGTTREGTETTHDVLGTGHDLSDDLGGRLDTGDHSGDLPCHEGAHLDISLPHGKSESAGTQLLDLDGAV